MKHFTEVERRAARAASSRNWRRKNPGAAGAAAKQWRRKNPEKVAASQRRRLYGVTPDGYAWMLEQQGGTCATCDSPAVCVDHDHDDGHVRGLLCHGCNAELGRIEKDRLRRRRLENYAECA